MVEDSCPDSSKPLLCDQHLLVGNVEEAGHNAHPLLLVQAVGSSDGPCNTGKLP